MQRIKAALRLYLSERDTLLEQGHYRMCSLHLSFHAFTHTVSLRASW